MKIAITRPKGKGEKLRTLLENEGIESLHSPVLSISALPFSSEQIAPILNADVIVFISTEAVLHLAKHIKQLPNSAKVYAVGQATAAAIVEKFACKVITPDQQDSEGMLALEELQAIDGQQLVIIKGKGGRGLLAKTFKARGAILNQCSLYERKAIFEPSDKWLDHWINENITAIVLTSNTAIDAVFNCNDERRLGWLKQCHFFLVSQRGADHLMNRYGISTKQLSVASGPDTDAIFNSIKSITHVQGSLMKAQHNTNNNDPKKPMTSVTNKSEPPASKNTTASGTIKVKQKISKVGLLALLLTLLTGLATTGLIIHGKQISDKTYAYLKELRLANDTLKAQLSATNNQLLALQEQQMGVTEQVKQRLDAQQSQFTTQLEGRLSEAQKHTSALQQDEVTYLLRLAQLKVTLEQDYLGAIAVLQRTANTVNKLPHNSAMVAAIASDIALLKGQVTVPTEAIYLNLHGLLSQVSNLPLQTIVLQEESATASPVLSDDISDWRSNISKTWQTFTDNVFRVEERQLTSIDPLLDAQEQQLLRAQLRAYLSQAQTALMDKQASIFYNALEAAHNTAQTYFDNSDPKVTALLNELEVLQQRTLTYHTTIELSSVTQALEWQND